MIAACTSRRQTLSHLKPKTRWTKMRREGLALCTARRHGGCVAQYLFSASGYVPQIWTSAGCYDLQLNLRSAK